MIPGTAEVNLSVSVFFLILYYSETTFRPISFILGKDRKSRNRRWDRYSKFSYLPPILISKSSSLSLWSRFLVFSISWNPILLSPEIPFFYLLKSHSFISWNHILSDICYYSKHFGFHCFIVMSESGIRRTRHQQKWRHQSVISLSTNI